MVGILNALVTRRFLKRGPFALSWALTFQCNQRCLYCRIWDNKTDELNTDQIKEKISYYANIGGCWITFTGGEPLLREDFPVIAEYARKQGFYVSVSSNGILVHQRIYEITMVNRVKLSLDGPVSIHDYVRGEGSYDGVMNAVETCQKYRVPVSLECVISKYNIGKLDFLLGIASKYKILISFQPVTVSFLGADNNHSHTPSAGEYHDAMCMLIKHKKKGAPIWNSLAGLRYLSFWPLPQKINCYAGSLFLRINPDGEIIKCDRQRPSLETNPVSQCNQCWCAGTLEANLMRAGNREAILNFLRNSTK